MNHSSWKAEFWGKIVKIVEKLFSEVQFLIQEIPSVFTHVGNTDVIIKSRMNTDLITDSTINSDRMWGNIRGNKCDTCDMSSPVKERKKACMSLHRRDFVFVRVSIFCRCMRGIPVPVQNNWAGPVTGIQLVKGYFR